MSTTPEVLAFPNIKAIISANGTAEVIVAGNSRVVPDGTSLQELRDNALALVLTEAKTLQRAVRVSIEDPEGHGELIVHPDNRVESVSYDTKPTRRRAEAPTTTPETVAPAVIETVPAAAPTPAQATVAVHPTIRKPMNPRPSAVQVPAAATVDTAPAAAEAPATRRSLKDTSFLVSAPVLEPATQGWRGSLTRLGFRMDPSPEELAEREDIRTVSQHWPGPRTIAVVNRKGGANKTPTVVMLSAILARYSGAATVAWDNNESQGTLGWRTEKGAHDHSVLDLIDSSTDAALPLHERGRNRPVRPPPDR